MLEKINIHKIDNLYLRRGYVILIIFPTTLIVMALSIVYGVLAFSQEFRECIKDNVFFMGAAIRHAWKDRKDTADD